MSMQRFDFSLPVNATRDVFCPGNFLRYMAGSAGGADESIIVNFDAAGSAILMKPGQLVRIPEGFTRILIANYANSATITGLLLAGQGDFQDNRITGEVSVIDGQASRTKAGVSFWASSSAGPVAGQYSHVQLWNPAASGKNVFCTELIVDLGAAGVAQVRTASAALSTFSINPVNKNIGGAASASEIRTESNAVLQGAAMSAFQVGTVAVSEKLLDPILLRPGFGIIIVPGIVNTNVRANFQTYEELV